MSEYEITYLARPDLAEDARGELDAAVDKTIEQRDGAIIFSTPSVYRRLGYDINEQSTSFIRTLQAELDPTLIEEVRKEVRKLDGVMRMSVIKTAQRKLIRIPTDEIDAIQKSSKSLMPDRILSDLTAQEAADLLKYIRSIGADGAP